MAVARGLLALLHVIEVGDGSWKCSCGAGSAGLTQEESGRQASAHHQQSRTGPTGPGARTAQDAFTEMVRAGLRPRLQALGFKGAGPTFTWPSATHYAQLGLQKSTMSSRAQVQFTVNVSVNEKAAWEMARTTKSYLPSKPSANTSYSVPGGWGSRIGSLLPSGSDAWWAVDAAGEWRTVATEVVDAVATFVVPQLRDRCQPR